jgi:ATP-dependent DNA helicase DinG
MKGRNNYACLHRIKRAENTPFLDGLEQIDQFDEVFRWMTRTETGDRAELSNLPENLPFWRHIDARSDTCLGQKCPDYEPCFITRMRQRAIDADVIVVNHHLFFADLALRNGAYGAVLPDYAAVILDEAHQIEDVASEYFGAQISNYQIDDLLRDVSYLKIEDVETQKELSRVSARISRFADLFWTSFPEGRGLDGRFTLTRRKSSTNSSLSDNAGEGPALPESDAYRALDNVLHRLETTLDILPDPPSDAESLLRRTRQMRFDLNFIVKADDKQFVYWLERRGRGVFLRASPIDVSGLLQDKLFEKVPTVVLTSATLSSAGNFRFIRERLGLDEGEEMIAESIFDFENQAVLYLPATMPVHASQLYARNLLAFVHVAQKI